MKTTNTSNNIVIIFQVHTKCSYVVTLVTLNSPNHESHASLGTLPQVGQTQSYLLWNMREILLTAPSFRRNLIKQNTSNWLVVKQNTWSSKHITIKDLPITIWHNISLWSSAPMTRLCFTFSSCKVFLRLVWVRVNGSGSRVHKVAKRGVRWNIIGKLIVHGCLVNNIWGMMMESLKLIWDWTLKT